MGSIVFDVKKIRNTVLEMAYHGKAVHVGCAFSIVEILAVLYRKHLRYNPNDPDDPERDYFVLSKGHGVMAQYACMHEIGWINSDAIHGYFSDNSNLMGLSDSRTPGLEVTSGSLGHGFSIGVGLAMGARLNQTEQKTYVLVGDGELNEGAIWEGVLFASHHKLKDFMVIVDQNGYQAMGSTEEILDLGSLQLKFQSFGFETVTVDGHDEIALDDAIVRLQKSNVDSPKALIAKTIKGKGVSFMEHNNAWHYTRLTSKDYENALREISEAKL